MQQVYVVHYSEIALKGRNRPMFLNCLQENICQATGLQKRDVKIEDGRLVIYPSPQSSPSMGEGRVRVGLAHVFGISSCSPAVFVEQSYAAIENTILNYARSLKFESFAIATTRGDKKFPMNSQELNIKLGAFVNETFGKKVNLTNPDVTFYVEVFSGGALVYTERLPGPGGLPVGSQASVAVMLSGGIDSPVAAYRIMKRGAPLIGIHCHSYPFTSRASIDKVKELAGVLSKYNGGVFPLYLVPLAEAQKAIVQNCSQEYRVLLYRRLMMKIAEGIARKQGAGALVTGEALGQVASQTVENIQVTDAAATLPVLRPLIGYDKDEIIGEARKIGTYEISILPHDDCCTIFMPKNPATRARLEDVEREETKINMQALVADAIARCEIATSSGAASSSQ